MKFGLAAPEAPKTIRGTSGDRRHTKLTRYRCSLPGLAGFAGNRCTEPEVPPITGLHRNFSRDATASRSLAYRSAPRKKMAAFEFCALRLECRRIKACGLRAGVLVLRSPWLRISSPSELSGTSFFFS